MSDELSWLDEEVKPKPLKPVATLKEEAHAKALANAAGIAPTAPMSRPPELIKAEWALPPQQRLLKDLVVHLPSIHEAYVAFNRVYPDVSRNRLWRWRQSRKFITALELTYQHLCTVHGVSRESLIHRLEQIREDAMAPKPILFKGEDTGFRENNPQHALKAIEQQSKLLKLYDEERSNVQVNLHVDFGSYGEPEPVIEGEAVEVEE